MKKYLICSAVCAAFCLPLSETYAAPPKNALQQDLYALCGTLVRMDGSDKKTADKVARFVARRLDMPQADAQRLLHDGEMTAAMRYAAWYWGEQTRRRLNDLPPLQTGRAERIRRSWAAELARIDAVYAAAKNKRQINREDIPTAVFLEQAVAELETNGTDVEKCIRADFDQQGK